MPQWSWWEGRCWCGPRVWFEITITDRKTLLAGDFESGNVIVAQMRCDQDQGFSISLQRKREGTLLIFLRHKSLASVNGLERGWYTMAQRTNLDSLPGVYNSLRMAFLFLKG